MSRVDACVDFELPGGISEDFLRVHKVCPSTSLTKFMAGDTLETYYCGKRGASLLLRIYNKSKDCHKKNKLWFFDLWGVSPNTEVWRFEYELHREVLKELGLETLDDLKTHAGSLWKYLTGWFSLRLPDNDRSNRRTTHPFWQNVVDCAVAFGEVSDIQRRRVVNSILPNNKYASRLMSSMITLAALERIDPEKDFDPIEWVCRKLASSLKMRDYDLLEEGKPGFKELLQKKICELQAHENLSMGERDRLYKDCPEDLI